ncbi:MAG TPA: hypothetical protein PKC22_15565, partial [Rhodocyclaceae bacterium]|nr:hypothetical protein [Rhodocyclaceae bacterium]
GRLGERPHRRRAVAGLGAAGEARLMRWPAILWWWARVTYLELVHARIIECAPHHPEVTVTWLEIQHARARFAAAWGPR